MASRLDRLARFAPGLPALLGYQRSDFPHDLSAGLAVAAVAVPVSVACAQLAGLPPVVGLYATILPLVAYALFGTSRQLSVGPGAPIAAIIAAGIAPLALGDEARHLDLTLALTLITGLLCIGASFLRLGALADFLSKPILVGFTNGVAIAVVLSQIGILFGIPIAASGIVGRASEFVGKLPQTHAPTLLVGLATIGVLVATPRVTRRLPGALIGIGAAAVAVHLLGLETAGVTTIGPVKGGLPIPRLPLIPWDQLPILIAEAAGLALVSFSSTMLAVRSFADRNRYEIDADREIAALGVANVAAAITQGFAVYGTNSRTAVGEAAGGRTQVTGIVAAAAIAIVLVAFTEPLQYIPSVALAAVLVTTGASLFNWRAMAAIRRIDRREFWIGMAATVGVIAWGVMNAVLFAVALALVNFVQLASRPKVEILGEIAGQPGFHSLSGHAEAKAPPGIVLFRFNGPVVFFSAAYFRREINEAVAAAGPGLKWFIIDLLAVNMVDATGLYAIQETFDQLLARGVVAGAAAREAQWTAWAAERAFAGTLARTRFFATLTHAVNAYKAEATDARPPPAPSR